MNNYRKFIFLFVDLFRSGLLLYSEKTKEALNLKKGDGWDESVWYPKNYDFRADLYFPITGAKPSLRYLTIDHKKRTMKVAFDY